MERSIKKLDEVKGKGDSMGKKISEMSHEELSEAGRRGGIASAEARRKKKAMKEIISAVLSMPLKYGKHNDVEDIKNFAALKGKNISVEEAMLIAQIQKAMKGDTAAAIFVRDTLGEKPSTAVDVNGAVPVAIVNDVEE